MNRTARWLIVLLLVLATPLRGYAAAAMVACGEAHHGKGEASSHVHADGQRHQHAAAEESDDAQAQHAHAHESAHGQSHADSSDNSAAQGASSCSACGACCLGVGVTSSVRFVVLPTAGSPAIPFHPRSFRGIVLEVFDPPPLARA